MTCYSPPRNPIRASKKSSVSLPAATRSRIGAKTDKAGTPTVRDRHVQFIAEKGRMAWQKATGYGRPSLVETTIGRYKHIIGPKLRARSSDGQQGKVAIAVHILNRMIRIAKPISARSS